MLFYESFLENCMSSYLGILYPLKDSFKEYNGEKVSYYISFFCIGCNFVLLVLTIWIIILPKEKVQDPKFEQKWNALTDGLKLDRHSRSFSLIFCLRRVIVFATIFYLIESGTMQVIFWSLANVVCFSIIG